MAPHARPQAHRDALPAVDHVLLLHRRLLRAPHPSRTPHARRRSRPIRYLQQALHHARHGDGLLFPDPRRPCRPRQFPDPDHDRRQGPRLPAHQPAQLVSLHHRRPADDLHHPRRRRRYRLDLLHSAQHRIPSDQRHQRRPRHLHLRLLLNPYRPQFHRHHPPHARPGHDAGIVCHFSSGRTTPPASFRCSARPSSPSRSCSSPSSGSSTSASSIPRSAAIRSSFSISSGSTRTPPSTS